MVATKSQFPIVDAVLILPEEAENGSLGICTNTSAPGQVLNEIDEKLRKSISVLGSLIVSRDGAERMILNSLAHPSITHLILFSEESLTFSPSTNLLLALEHGIDTSNTEHNILNGKAASAHYPNLSERVVHSFRDQIIVLPMFMYKNDYTKSVVAEYLEWLKPKIDEKLYEFLKDVNGKKSIYYDSLNALIKLLQSFPQKKKDFVELDPKEFKHLQPPKVILEDVPLDTGVPFSVSSEGAILRLDIEVGNESFYIKGTDEFLLEYSLMKYLGEKKKLLSPLTQLFLGAELARVSTEIKNSISFPTFVDSKKIEGKVEIQLEPKVSLVTDKRFYYKISVKENQVAVMCLAFDVCEEVFELRSVSLNAIFNWLSEQNRFEDYEMDVLHRMDVGAQIARAFVASKNSYAFIQDFSSIFKVNTTDFPFLSIEADSFLSVHKGVLTKLYTEGLTEEHGDKRKGLARSAAVLAIYRDTVHSLENLPALYKQGDKETAQIRTDYKQQLLRLDHDGDYSYGERTRVHFGFDQLLNTIAILTKNPKKASAIERFDARVDMTSSINPETGKPEYTHDPCLTHDIFFVRDNKLHSFHISRAHNMVNAYPENIFGLYDAYVTTIREGLGVGGGDMYMLSSRGNILLLNEEQRTRKIISEPSKPSDDLNTESGPYRIHPDSKKISDEKSHVSFMTAPLTKVTTPPKSKIIERLRSFEGQDTIAKAVGYLKQKGGLHNNPILGEYLPGKDDPQGDYLLFFQANVMGKKIEVTAVFMNHEVDIKADLEVLNYIATQFSETLDYPLGNLVLFYVG